MGFLKGLFNRTVVYSDWFNPLNTTSSPLNGLSTDASLNISSVFSCINVKANYVAKLPLQVFQETNDSRKRVKDHPVSYLLETRPNPYQSPFSFWQTVEIHRNTYGVSYIKKEYKGTKITALYILDPSLVTVVINKDSKTKETKVFYVEATEEGQNVYTEDEIIRFAYFSLDGFITKSPLTVLRETLNITYKQTEFLKSYYDSGTLSRGVIETDEPLGKDAKENIRSSWLAHTSGIGNYSKVAVLDGGLKYKPLTIPLQDAELINTQKFNIEEIARTFNVPLHMINSMEGATFSNIESQSMSFVNNTISPICTSIEQELNYKLFSTSERQKGYYVKFNMASVLRGDSQARANYYKTMVDMGAYSINEVRALEDKMAIEHGDKHRVDLNHVSVEIADEYQMNRSEKKNN